MHIMCFLVLMLPTLKSRVYGRNLRLFFNRKRRTTDNISHFHIYAVLCCIRYNAAVVLECDGGHIAHLQL